MLLEQTIHPVYTEPGLAPLYFIVPGDGTRAYCLGEMWELEHIRDKLDALIEHGTHDGQLDEFDERISEWLTVAEASRRYGIPAATIRWACRNGKIDGALAKPWRASANSYRKWRHNVPAHKPGRKAG